MFPNRRELDNARSPFVANLSQARSGFDPEDAGTYGWMEETQYFADRANGLWQQGMNDLDQGYRVMDQSRQDAAAELDWPLYGDPSVADYANDQMTTPTEEWDGGF